MIAQCSAVHIEEFTNARVYKSQFWQKHELFYSFWVAMDLIRFPGVLDKTFGPLGVHRVLNLGTEGANSSFEFCPILMPIQVFFSILTMTVWKKFWLHLHTHHTKHFCNWECGKFCISTLSKHIVMLQFHYVQLL